MKNFLTIFPQESLDCSFDQIFDKVLPEVWEILFHFLELFICFLKFVFDLWFNWSQKHSLEKLLWTQKM